MMTLIGLIGLVVSIFTAVFLWLDWSPLVRPRLTAMLVDRKARRYVLRMEIENTSRVAAVKATPDGCRLQMLAYSISAYPEKSEFVPFTQEKNLTNPEENERLPAEQFRCAKEVFTTTTHLYPREVIAVERVVVVPEGTYLHCAFQFRAQISWVTRLVFRFKQLASFEPAESWTTTFVIYPKAEHDDDKKD